MTKKVFFICFILVFFSIFLYLAYLYRSVEQDISYRIKHGLFEEAMASESPVYYDDGKTLIGVFFKKTHRRYLHYDEIPKLFIKALIATEDQRFFEHHGFDIKAILRAFIANLKAGRIVEGGSTITQQLAKNIFGRRKRTYSAKLKELFQAILLEKRFSKEKILEMYCNQFFVTGYGKGLQIAARYFFDKDARELTLVEAAFIAGALHAPARYNPFIKKTEAERKRAILLAKRRKDYVLKRMFEMHFITKEQYLEAKKKPVPFKKGKITYALNVIMDYIKEQLESEYMKSILRKEGIENIATSGIRIYTSINKDIQKGALLALRKKLPLLDVKLRGYKPETEEEISKIRNSLMKPLPQIATVTEVDKKKCLIKISLKDKKEGIIDEDGLKQIVTAWIKWKKGRQARYNKKYVSLFLKNIRKGDKVAVWPDQKEGRYTLTKIPKLEGAVVVLQNGMIKAMVGGYCNVFFNRAVDAKRQLGSIFKPFLFVSALKLKWNTLDELYDIRDLYRFEDTYYFPKPDHTPPSQKVSMAWAGVKSENLASVWLLYHLMDRLNMEEFEKVAAALGLAKRRWETYDEYAERIRDKYGILINKEILKEAAFSIAKKKVKPDIIFSGHEEVLNIIPRLHWSIKEEILDKELGLYPEKIKKLTPEEIKEKEKIKKEILRYDFQRLYELNQEMKSKYSIIMDALYNGRLSADMLNEFYLDGQRIVYTEDKIDFPHLDPKWLASNSSSFKEKEIWINDIMPSGIIDLIYSYTEKEYKRLSSIRAYDPEVLYRIPDFRVLVGLHYVVNTAKKLGISTHLDPVLSFPLGPNSISIIEAAVAYQTIITGKLYHIGEKLSPSMLPIIKKITDRHGNLIWKYEPESHPVLSKRVSAAISEVLRNVVKMGTGRKADGAVVMKIKQGGEQIKVPIPCFGKTGTANHFTNSSFIGIVPGINRKQRKLELRKGYVIAVYVSYDDNTPMKNQNISIYGASGALPIWISTANSIVNSQFYKNNIQPADIVFTNPKEIILPEGDQFIYVNVSPITGLPTVSSGFNFPKILANARKNDSQIIFLRRFEP